MANVNFGNPNGAAAAPTSAAPVNNPTPAPVSDIPSSAVAKRDPLAMADALPEFRDLILPRINLVQGVGQLKDTFQQGGIVYGQATTLFTPPVIRNGVVEKAAMAPLNVTILGFRPTRFAERVEGGARGLIVNSEKEVASNGGTTDWNEWNMKKAAGMRLFQTLAEAMVAIERPAALADDDTIFVYECNGKKYALAIWGFKGAAYTAACKRVLFTARLAGCLRNGYPTHSFSVTTRLEKFGTGNSAWVPVFVAGAKSSPEFLTFTAGILNTPTVDGAATADGADGAAD